MCGLASPFHQPTLKFRRAETDQRCIIKSRYCTDSKVHCALMHECKTDTCFNPWLNSGGWVGGWLGLGELGGGLDDICWNLKCHPLGSQGTHAQNGNAASFWKLLSISKLLLLIRAPGSIAPAIQPGLTQTKGDKCYIGNFLLTGTQDSFPKNGRWWNGNLNSIAMWFNWRQTY